MKIKAIILTVMMMLSGFTAQASEMEYSYYMLRPENFVMPQNAGTWKMASMSAGTAGYIPGSCLSNGSMSDDPVTASIYIETAATYVIWGLAIDSASAAYMAGRHAKIAIDGVYDPAKFTSTVPGYSWTKSAEKVLEKGWHTIWVKTGYPTMNFAAVFITNNLDFVLSRDTDYEEIKKYEDTTNPEFTGNITSEYISDTQCDIILPEAEDQSGVLSYKFFLNDKETETEEFRFKLQNLLPLEESRLRVEATDRYGNKAENVQIIVNSPVEVSAVINGEGGRAAADVTVKNRTSVNRNVTVAVAVYTKNYDRMLSVDCYEDELLPGAELSKTVSAAITGTEDYIVYAMVWDGKTSAGPYCVAYTWEVGEDE